MKPSQPAFQPTTATSGVTKNRRRAARRCAPLLSLALGLASSTLPPRACAQPHGLAGFGTPAIAQSVTDLRFTDFDAAKAEGLRKELRILSRVFERLTRRPDTEHVNASRMGIPMLLTPAEPAVSITHLEGFGILLSLETDMPLVPTASPRSTPRSVTRDSEWEAARRELDGEQPHEAHPVTHDPDRVLEFRRQLIAALRQATNLHHLAPDDVVAVIATGPAGSAPGGNTASGDSASPAGAGTPSPNSGDDSNPGSEQGTYGGVTAGGGVSFGVYTSSRSGFPPQFVNRMRSFDTARSPAAAESAPDQASFLTLRVTKADLDQLAQGNLDAETFSTRLTINAYQGPRASSSTPRGF